MAVFQFVGIAASSGKEQRGVRDADNMKGLRAALRREGILLTSASESKSAEAKKTREIQFLAFLKRPSIGDVAMLTRQLATLVRAGIPLSESISALADQADNHEMKRILTSVREEVNQGIAFAVALSEHQEVFPALYVNMVAAGEASGNLETVLERLADFTDSQSRLRGKVFGAMAYPLIMLVIGSILVSVLMMGVVPKVTAIFASLDRALPWYTAVLILVSNGFVSPVTHGLLYGVMLGANGYLLLNKPAEPLRIVAQSSAAPRKKKQSDGKLASTMLTFALGMVALESFYRESATALLLSLIPGLVAGATLGSFLAWLKTDAGRIARDSAILAMPIFGPVAQMIAVARFAKTLATLLASGVQLLRAMEIVRAVIGNAAIERVIEDAASSIREGESIAEPLRRSKRFPPIMTHMIAVGEKSGQLEQMLEAVSSSYESTVEVRITALTSLLEPLTIVVMGGAVGFIAFAILMPLIQMNDFNQ
jgi:general secretion pathway protein F